MENLMEGKHSMDKGVELLLARRKTNPEEFEKGGRWENILHIWDIDLDTPVIFPPNNLRNPEQLHEAVMKKLLEGEQPSYTATLAEAMMKTKGVMEEAILRSLYK